MITKAVSTRMTVDELNVLNEMADFYGVTASHYVHDAVMERLEDENDYNDGMTVLAQKNANVGREDVLREVMG